jgi:putative transposase
MARKAADAAISATKQELVAMGRKHCRDLRLVDPKHTTTDCAPCGARTKHALPLSERTYTCTVCGHTAPRDKNSAHVMLVRAGFVPVGVDRGRPGGPPGPVAA